MKAFAPIALGLVLVSGCTVLATDDTDRQSGAIDLRDGADGTTPVGAQTRTAGGARDPRGSEGDVSATPAAMPAAGSAAPAPTEPSKVPDEGPPVSVVTDTEGDPDEPSETTCPAFPTELLTVEGAGSGTTSGCEPRTCAGVSIPPDFDQLDDAAQHDPAEYEGCTVIDGDLVVANHPRSDLRELACLELITGSVVIWDGVMMRSLHGLESLQQVSGGFEIGLHDNVSSGIEGFRDLDALVSLRAIGGRLGISGGPGLERWAELPALVAVGGEVFFEFFRGVSELSGMNALTHVGGSFSLWRPEGLTAVTGLRALTSIGTHFVVWGATDLVELDGLPSLACIGGFVDIGGSASWEHNPVLRKVGPFPALRTVGNELMLEDNPVLESFEMYRAVEHAGSLRVTNNPALASLPLDALTSCLGLVVHDNASLPDCGLRDAATRVGLADQAAAFSQNAACP